MLQNAYLLANIGADTAENEQHFAENFGPLERRRPPSPGPTPPHRGRRDRRLLLSQGGTPKPWTRFCVRPTSELVSARRVAGEHRTFVTFVRRGIAEMRTLRTHNESPRGNADPPTYRTRGP